MDLKQYSYDQLLELLETVDGEIKHREREEKAKARAQILEIAKLHGLLIDELLAKAVKKSKPVAAKYCNPNDPSQTWSGRGRKPAWVEAQLAAGKTLESLSV